MGKESKMSLLKKQEINKQIHIELSPRYPGTKVVVDGSLLRGVKDVEINQPVGELPEVHITLVAEKVTVDDGPENKKLAS